MRDRRWPVMRPALRISIAMIQRVKRPPARRAKFAAIVLPLAFSFSKARACWLFARRQQSREDMLKAMRLMQLASWLRPFRPDQRRP